MRPHPAPPIKIGVVGATGYTGIELLRVLARHPLAQLVACFSSLQTATKSPTITRAVPALSNIVEDVPLLPAEQNSIAATGCDVVFLCIDHAHAHDLAPHLLEAGLIVVDLSAGFRLTDPTEYDAYYGFSHTRPDLLATRAYGLCEFERNAIRRSDLIACPGCYPTAAALALRPLIQADVVDTNQTVIVDATSGVSGAGRTPTDRTHFCSVSQSPYGVLGHRHTPEITQAISSDVLFTPHLGPYDRGILSTAHAALRPGTTEPHVREVFEAAYADEPFVRLLPAGAYPSVAAVVRTNFADIGLAFDERRGRVIVFSAIDNLLKGAAGQAVQCMNTRLGTDETLGLLGVSAAEHRHADYGVAP